MGLQESHLLVKLLKAVPFAHLMQIPAELHYRQLTVVHGTTCIGGHWLLTGAFPVVQVSQVRVLLMKEHVAHLVMYREQFWVFGTAHRLLDCSSQSPKHLVQIKLVPEILHSMQLDMTEQSLLQLFISTDRV